MRTLKLKRKLKGARYFKYCPKSISLNICFDCSACEFSEPLKQTRQSFSTLEIFQEINRMKPGDRWAVANCRGDKIG